MFEFFDASEAIDFGKNSAKIILKKNASFLGKKERLKDVQKQELYEASMKELEKTIKSFKRKNSLNFYKKAQMGKVFKFHLIDGGIDIDFAQRLTMWLMLRMG